MPASALIDSATLVAQSLADARLGDDELVAAIRLVGELRRLVDGAGIELTARLSERCATGGEDAPDRRRGHAGPVGLVESEARLERREAASWSTIADATAERTSLLGETLPARRPAVAAAVEAGELGDAAATRIIRALDDAEAHADAERLGEFERVLVDAAPHLTDRELRGACLHLIDLVDPDGAEPREDEVRRRESVTIHQQDDGLTRLVALLHPEAAGYVLAALDARTAPRRQPTFADDDATDPDQDADRRPVAQRRVDALMGIARDALAHDPGQVAGSPVTVIVTMTEEQLRTGLGAAHIIGIDEPISAGTARRMAAAAGIVPAVLGTDTEPLDLGRAHRLATPAQRRALALRDGGCIWCGAPPGWCEAAHILAWIAGGRTDLQNLVLLCPFHHHLFDREGWGLEWRADAPWLIPPPHVDPTRTPRLAGPKARLRALAASVA